MQVISKLDKHDVQGQFEVMRKMSHNNFFGAKTSIQSNLDYPDSSGPQ